MKDSEFFFDYSHLLYFKCQKINPICGKSSIDSPDWIKCKKAKINPLNKKYNKCFQYVLTVALNYEEMNKDPQKIKKVKPFKNKYDFKRTNFLSEKMIGKKVRKMI